MLFRSGLNPGPPALEASTIPLGYRGGGNGYSDGCIQSKQNINVNRNNADSKHMADLFRKRLHNDAMDITYRHKLKIDNEFTSHVVR